MRIFTGAPLRSRERRRALDKFQSKTLRRNKTGASKVHRPCSSAGFWDEIAPAPSASSSVKAEGRCGRRPIRPGNRFPKETVTVPGGGFCFSAHGQGPKRTDRDRNGKAARGELQNGENACGPPPAAARRLPISHRFPSDLAGAGSRVCPQGHRSGQAA